MPVHVTPKTFGAAFRKRLKQDVKLARKAGMEAANRGVARVVQATNEKGAVDQRTYKDGWKAVPTDDGAALVNDTPYASVIEYGRRPGAPGPPVGPIVDWVRRKLVPEGKVAPNDVDNAAFAIRNAIHERGTPPKYVLRDILPELGAFYREAVISVLEREQRRRGGGGGGSRLSAGQVRKIRALAADGMSRKAIASQFGVTAGHVGKIVRGKAHAGVK